MVSFKINRMSNEPTIAADKCISRWNKINITYAYVLALSLAITVALGESPLYWEAGGVSSSDGSI